MKNSTYSKRQINIQEKLKACYRYLDTVRFLWNIDFVCMRCDAPIQHIHIHNTLSPDCYEPCETRLYNWPCLGMIQNDFSIQTPMVLLNWSSVPTFRFSVYNINKKAIDEKFNFKHTKLIVTTILTMFLLLNLFNQPQKH